METTQTTPLTETISPQQLGDRIVELLQERSTYMQMTQPGYTTDPSQYGVACQVFELALALGESSESIHAALGHLHRAKRIQGFNVALRNGSPIYCIALRDWR
jgi:hypothetical protein